jgi:glucosylceramidase
MENHCPINREQIPVKKLYRQARVIRTARDTNYRHTETEVLEVRNKPEKSTVSVQAEPHDQYQVILGFGGAFTESGAYALSKISPQKRQEAIDAYFSPTAGLNYSLCRVHMNSCDFSLGNYSCDDTDGDIALKDFNINRDRQYLIPFIKDALKSSGSPVRLLVSPWSPPAWMKTNGNMNYGGRLQDQYRESWALFFSKFIEEYEREGIPIWGVSVQNEPMAAQTWDSCLYTAEEERDFVRDFLGPRLQLDGYGAKKILIWDHNRDLLYERALTILSDEMAAKYVWGIGFHWYCGEQFDNVAKTYQDFPDKPLIFTEGCIERGVKLGQWDRGEIYAHNMIGDLNSGTAGWIDWNMVLDQTGGPNHAGNYCDAPVIADTEANQVFYQSSYYYIGHFSKYITGGARRVGCINGNPNLETAAFLNPDGNMVVIVLNRTDEDYALELEFLRLSVHTESHRHSILTVIAE